MASVVKVSESRKSQSGDEFELMTSLPLEAPVGQTPACTVTPIGSVPLLNRPVFASNICITKSPATLAASVQATELFGSNFARAVNAAKMSALFSVDLPRLSVLGGAWPNCE